MPDDVRLLGTYLHLARAAQQRRRSHVCDRLLVLAGVAAEQLELPGIAAICRQKILLHNPHHLIGRWPTVQQGLENDEFLVLLRQLFRRYPREKVESMLESVGIDLAREREAYFSDEEYAAALLGMLERGA